MSENTITVFRIFRGPIYTTSFSTRSYKVVYNRWVLYKYEPCIFYCWMKHMICRISYESYGMIWATTQYELLPNTEYDFIRDMLRVKLVRLFTRYVILMNHVWLSTRRCLRDIWRLWGSNAFYGPMDFFEVRTLPSNDFEPKIRCTSSNSTEKGCALTLKTRKEAILQDMSTILEMAMRKWKWWVWTIDLISIWSRQKGRVALHFFTYSYRQQIFISDH